MLLVIWGHISSIGFNFIYSFHMPVFFVISGYFFRQRAIKDVIHYSFRRLIIPYIVICAVATIIIIAYGYGIRELLVFIFTALWGAGSSLNTAHYFSTFPNIGPIWFLLALFWCLIAFNFIIRIKNDIHVLLVIASLFLLSTLIGRFVFVAPFSILSGLCALPFMYYGYFARNHEIKRKLEIPLLAVWGGVILFSHMNIARCYFECYYLDVFGGIGGYLAFLKLSSYIQKVKVIANGLSFIGRNSIVYLCFHYIVNVYFHFDMNDFLFYIIQIIVLTMIVILLSVSKVTRDIFKISLK